MQLAGLHDAVELAFQLHHLVVDGAAVALDLRLARAADKAEAAALAFEVGPGPHQPRALVGQRGQFHLQHALARLRPVGEDLEDQTGAVQQLHAPFAFEVALLRRRHRPVDKHEPDAERPDPLLQLGHLARPEQKPRLRTGNAHHLGACDRQARQRRGQRHRLGQTVFGQASGARRAQVGVQHIADRRARRGVVPGRHAAERRVFAVLDVVGADDQSSPS